MSTASDIGFNHNAFWTEMSRKFKVDNPFALQGWADACQGILNNPASSPRVKDFASKAIAYWTIVDSLCPLAERQAALVCFLAEVAQIGDLIRLQIGIQSGQKTQMEYMVAVLTWQLR